MDAWWPKLRRGASSSRALGDKAFDALEGMIATGDHTGGSPDAPDFFDGWWGYVSKDLRDLYGAEAEGRLEPRLLRRRLEDEVPRGAAADPARGAEGHAGSSSTAAATATAPPTRSRPASTRTGRRSTGGDRRCRRSRSRTGPTFQQVVTLTQRLPR